MNLQGREKSLFHIIGAKRYSLTILIEVCHATSELYVWDWNNVSGYAPLDSVVQGIYVTRQSVSLHRKVIHLHRAAPNKPAFDIKQRGARIVD